MSQIPRLASLAGARESGHDMVYLLSGCVAFSGYGYVPFNDTIPATGFIKSRIT
jgi:hypothetical protein